MNIQVLIKNYSEGIKTYQKNTYNETQLRNDFLDPFFELLGWDLRNNQGKPTNEREVLVEEGLKAGAEQNTKKPDYTFRLFAERKFFVEAKKPSVKVERNDSAAKQVRRYGYTAKLKISVLTNFEYLIIYDCTEKVEGTNTYNTWKIKQYHYTEYPEKLDELKKLLGKNSVYSGAFDEEWEELELNRDTVNVDNLFLQQINSWRLQLGKEFLRLKEDIEEEELNDLVQGYLNRILFLRVCEDRNIEEYQTLFNYATTEDFAALANKFEVADKRYNSRLFEQSWVDKILGDVESVFWEIIQALYYPESPYSFSVFSSDVLGSIYEIFLSDTLIIKGKELILQAKPEQVDRDIVTTPTNIIRDILRETLVKYCEDKPFGKIMEMRLADIACGSGAFLLESYQVLQDILIDKFLVESPESLIPNGVHSFKLPFQIKRDLLLNCIYGIDKDYNAVEAAKFGLLLKLLEGENVASLGNDLPLLPSLDDNIEFGNSLLNTTITTKLSEEELLEVNPYDFEEGFDVIVGNPPYMKSEDMKAFTPKELPLYKKHFDWAFKQFDKYFLFLEQSVKELLNDNGYYGFIIPSKFTKVGAAKNMRAGFRESDSVLKIVSFGANQIFNSKTTYTCLLIGKNTNNEGFLYHEVGNIQDWKIRAVTEDDFENVSWDDLDDEGWVLVPKKLRGVYDSIQGESIPLQELLGGREYISNGIQTSANGVYVFTVLKEDENYYYFENKEGKQKIEKELTRPYYQTSRGKDNLYTYNPFLPNSRVIYPYKKNKDEIDFVELNELIKNYPFLYRYLNSHKTKLIKRDIKPSPETQDEWYRYGRHQSLDRCEVDAKIIVGVLATGDKYAIDYNQTLISSGGTAGYCMISLPDDCPYNIYYIQAILNSKYLEWCSGLMGEVFRGGYIARGTKVLKRLPIKTINFANKEEKATHDDIAKRQEQLILLYNKSQQLGKRGAGLRRRFDSLIQEQQERLKALYGLEKKDSLVPSIEELYATD
jgi:type I restriction-modification system DNA methylase subunit